MTSTKDPSNKAAESELWKMAAWAFLFVWTLIAVIFVFYNHYVEDEGFYCLISRDVWKGRGLYSDIRFTQTPLLPYVYGAFLKILPARIESGRVISLLFSVAGLVLAWKMLSERYRPGPALFGVALIAVSKAFLMHMIAVKTPALTFFFGTCSLYFLSRFDLVIQRDPSSAHGAAFRKVLRMVAYAGLFAGLTVLTRISALPLAIGVPALAFYRTTFRGRAGRAIVAWSLPGSLGLPLVVLLAYAAVARGRLWFDLYGYNTAIGHNATLSNTIVQFIQSVFADNAASTILVPIATLLVLGTALSRPLRLGSHKRRVRHPDWAAYRRKVCQPDWGSRSAVSFEVAVTLIWWAITLIHATRRPSYSFYQVNVAWGPLIIGAWAASRLTERFGKAAVALLCVLLIAGLFVPGQETALVSIASQRPAGVYQAAAPVRAAGNVRLLTFDAGIAFCAPRTHLMQGYEMSEFSMAPDWVPDSTQIYTRGVSQPKLLSDIQQADMFAINNRPLMLLDDDTFHNLMNYVHDNFHKVGLTDKYGQFHNDFMVILARNGPPSH